MIKKIIFYLSRADFLKNIFCVMIYGFLLLFFFFSIFFYINDINRREKMNKMACNIGDEINLIFSENEKLLNYMKFWIAKNRLAKNSDAFLEFLKEIGNTKLSFLFTSYVSWANKNGYILLTSKGGVFSEKLKDQKWGCTFE